MKNCYNLKNTQDIKKSARAIPLEIFTDRDGR